jgi:hypothetical protein
MDEFGPLEIANMFARMPEVMDAINYLNNNTDTSAKAMNDFNKCINEALNGGDMGTRLKHSMRLYNAGMFDAIIDYANSVAKLSDACNRYSSYHKPVEIIHNSEDILRKLKEAKDNGDNNS